MLYDSLLMSTNMGNHLNIHRTTTNKTTKNTKNTNPPLKKEEIKWFVTGS